MPCGAMGNTVRSICDGEYSPIYSGAVNPDPVIVHLKMLTHRGHLTLTALIWGLFWTCPTTCVGYTALIWGPPKQAPTQGYLPNTHARAGPKTGTQITADTHVS